MVFLFTSLRGTKQSHCLFKSSTQILYFPSQLPWLMENLFLLSFSLDEKETKNQGKKMLLRSRPMLARFFTDPTLIVNGIIEL